MNMPSTVDLTYSMTNTRPKSYGYSSEVCPHKSVEGNFSFEHFKNHKFMYEILEIFSLFYTRSSKNLVCLLENLKIYKKNFSL